MFVCSICKKEFENREKYGGHMSGHARMGRKRGEYVNKRIEFIGTCLSCGKVIKSRNKYCSIKCQQASIQKEWEEKWISGEVNGYRETNHWGKVPDRIRTYLFRKYDNKCAVCGWGERNPYTGRIPLEVEHLDGNYKNNRPENVTLLCPNCHSLTKTYRGANMGKGRRKTWKLIEDK